MFDYPRQQPGVNDVYLAIINTGAAGLAISNHADILPVEELLRINNLKSVEHQRRSRDSYILRRLILGSITNKSPDQIVFECSDFGKPQIRNGKDVAFSISHSGNLFAIAISTSRRLGLDIETIAGKCNSFTFLGGHLLGSIDTASGSGSNSVSTISILKNWTLREAYLKASDNGVGIPNCCVDRDFPLRAEYAWLKGWQNLSLNDRNEYVGTLMVEGDEPVNLVAIDFKRTD